VSDTDDLEEYWAVVRPVRLPPAVPVPTIVSALEDLEFWVSLLDDQGREQTPRIRVGAMVGTFTFPPVSGPMHIARMALWGSEVATVAIRHVSLEVGVNLLPGDSPNLNYRIGFEEPFTTVPIRGFQSSS
jgi:hypothetical protein